MISDRSARSTKLSACRRRSSDAMGGCDFTVDTTVKLTGTASKGQKVQIKDGATVKDEATADATTGEWTLTMTGLGAAAHSFTATALYNPSLISAPYTLTVANAATPVITSVQDAYGN